MMLRRMSALGFTVKKVNSGVKKWRAIWLHKVQFAEPEDTNATKGDAVEFGTATIEGTIMLDDKTEMEKRKNIRHEATLILSWNDKGGNSC